MSASAIAALDAPELDLGDTDIYQGRDLRVLDRVSQLEAGDVVPPEPCLLPPASLSLLRRRIELGLPLWHEDDRFDYNGLTGAIRPREST